MEFVARNPATGLECGRYRSHSHSDVDEILDAVHGTWLQWRSLPYTDRAVLMFRAARILRDNAQRYAVAMTEEMGKPLTQSLAEVEKCAWVCEYYAEHTEKILDEERVDTDARESVIRFDPIGPVLAVMPWNFPFWQVFRFAAPALMAGNAGVLKHASNVPHCGLLIEEVFREAGFPQHLFRTLMIESSQVASVIADPRIAAVTLTGSEYAGSMVAAAAGKEIKKCVLELGGSDPFIVLADADVKKAAQVAAVARMLNTGQSCIAAKRFIIQKEIMQEFVDAFISAVSAKRLGDPMDPETEVGSMAREDLLEELHEQVRRSIDAGAQCVLGGERVDRSGAFYPPTILTQVRPGMAAFDEELFGPVAAVIEAKDADDAIRLANLSCFGLGASLWTRDLSLAKRLASQIESGSVFVNGMVKSDPRLPFGGIKKSGFGRELAGYGIKEFVNIKTVWIGA